MKKDKENLKVLFLPKWYPVPVDPQNGIFVKKHAEALALYANVTVIYIKQDPNLKVPYSAVVQEEKIREVFIYYKQNRSALKSLINTFRYLKSTFFANKIIRSKGFIPDIIHVHVLTRPALLAIFYKIFKRTPYFITEHWTGYASGLYEKWPGLKKSVHQYVINTSSGITAVSESLKGTLSKITSKEVTVIPNVIDSSFQYKSKEEGNKKIILTVADLHDNKKNVSGIIDAIASISEQRKDFEYHIIGGGPDLEKLKRLAINLVADGVVKFHGEQPNSYVAGFMPKADFVVVNSNYETFCVIGIEALASGKPVIATISGGPEEYMKEEYGLLIQKGDKEALMQSILYMLDNYQSYDGKKISGEIQNAYSMERIGRMLFEYYQKGFEKSVLQ